MRNENIYNHKLTLKCNENKSFHSLIKDTATVYIPNLRFQHINGGEAAYLLPSALKIEERNKNIYNQKLILPDNENKSFHSLIRDTATVLIY